MDDKERIEYIIKDKGLSNVEFSNLTGIAPATISHISSGRSRPTLAILKGIVAGFPDLNPEWVFMGTGRMYKNPDEAHTSTSVETPASVSGSYDLFSNMEQTDHGKHETDNRMSRLSPAVPAVTNTDEIKDIIRESFDSMMYKRRRQIVEVRIFFDDGTYEAFSTPKDK